MALPKMDKSLDFAQLLRNELPLDFPIASSTLTAEQQRQLTEAQERLLSGIVTTHDERTRSSLFSTSLDIIEGFISSIRVRSAVLMLGIAYLVFHIVDDKLYKRLYGCVSKEEYFLRTSLLPIFGPTTLHNLYWEGYALEMFQFQLLSGSFGIPAFTFEFIATNRTKLLDFPAAVQQFDPHDAVLHFRDDSSREFTTWVKNGVPTQALNAEGSDAQDAPEPSPEAEARKAQAKARAEARKQRRPSARRPSMPRSPRSPRTTRSSSAASRPDSFPTSLPPLKATRSSSTPSRSASSPSASGRTARPPRTSSMRTSTPPTPWT